ncbi:MAG: hypothetical protein AAB874_03160 [Patescibacteria group bacterium]
MITDKDVVKLKQVFATKDDFKGFATKDDLKRELKPIKDDIADIRKKMNSIISFFDREYLAFRKRVEFIEKHLHISPQQ